MRDLFNTTSRAFYRWGGWHSLDAIDEETWRVGLAERFEMAGFDLTPPAGVRLVALGEGHPRATMLLAKQAYLAVITAGTTSVGEIAVEQALDAALAAERPYHDQVVEDLRRTGRHVLDTAERVADRRPAVTPPPGVAVKGTGPGLLSWKAEDLSVKAGRSAAYRTRLAAYLCGMRRVRVSTTVDADLLRSARALRVGLTDAALLDEALGALVASHRRAVVDASYRSYDDTPLGAPDEWGDLASFRDAAGLS